MTAKQLLLTIWLLCLYLKGAGQSYYFRQYQVENGLSYNSVFCTLQDRQGFMWFGTRDGLNRFDGYRFKVFRNDPDDSSSIGANFIYSLYQNNDSVIWVGTERGLFLYHPATEKFSRFSKAVSGGGIRDIKCDTAGNVWMIISSVLMRYQPKNGSLQTFSQADGGNVTSICIDSSQNIWVSSALGNVLRYDAATKRFVSINVFRHSPVPVSFRIEKIVVTGGNKLLIATSAQGVKVFDIAYSDYQDILTNNSDGTGIYARDFVQQSASEYWIATESGLYRYQMSTGEITHLQKNFSDPYSLSDNAVYCLCKDREGGVWAGTYFGGVNYLPNQPLHFDKYYHGASIYSIPGNVVREICKDRFGRLWVGMEDAGLCRIDTASGSVKSFLPGSGSKLAYTNIQSLLADGDYLWIGTYEHGIDVMDLRSEKIIRHYENGNSPHDLKSNFIVTFYKTQAGKILIGTSNGLYQYNALQNNFETVTQVPPHNFVSAVNETSDGIIWVATAGNGVFYFNPFSGTVTNLKQLPNNTGSLLNNRVNGIYNDGNLLCFPTEGGGVSVFNRSTRHFIQYTTKNGLPSNFVFRVLKDNMGHYWISTSKGLVCLETEKNSVKTYTRANGLLTDQFNYNAAFKDKSGRLYFGSAKGLISFVPTTQSKRTVSIFPVFITGFQINNSDTDFRKKTANENVLSPDKPIELRYNESTFSIDFAALSFTAPGTIRYQYRLDGLEKKWTQLNSNRKVYFTQLPPGHYTFQVQASTDGGTWGPETSLPITVKPVWYASPLAYAVYIMLAGLLVYFIIQEYHRRIQEKNRRKLELLAFEKEKEVYQAKIDFFTNIAHEIKTPLTLIKAPMEKIIRRNHFPVETASYLKLMEKNTDRLITLTNQLLDFRQVEAKGFSLSFVSCNISELITDIFQSFKILAEQRQLDYTLQLPQQEILGEIDIEAVHKIVSNLLDNAIKYSHNKVVINLSNNAEKKSAVLMVNSDGYLIEEADANKIFEPFFRLKATQQKNGSGIGLALSRSLAELQGGQLHLLSAFEGMNRFELILPLQPKNKLV